MGKRNRVYGLMVGITIGFAFWGSVQIQPKNLAGISQVSVIRIQSSATFQSDQKEQTSPEYFAKASEISLTSELESTNRGIIRTAKEEKNTEENSVQLHALSAVLMDGDTGRILYEKAGDTFRPMASTTKIMTCILALEKGAVSDICTMSETAASQPKVHLGAGKGTQFYMKDLLYSLMLESHNDSAVMIAEQIGGSVEGFSALMNQKARELGCQKTCFLTPNGLDRTYTAPDGQQYTHGTTAKELATIMRYCVRQSPKREEFLEITRASNHTFTDVEGNRSFSCVNHNALLSMMKGLLSGKTGFTGGAGYSYVAALEDEGRTYVLALLGSGWPPHKTYKWADARELFNYGKSHFQYRDVYKEPVAKGIPVRDGIIEGTRQAMIKPVTRLAEKDKHLRLLLAKDEQVELREELPDILEAPVEQGELIGHIGYYLDGKLIRKDPLYADRDIARRDFKYCVWQVWERFIRKHL